MAKKLYIIQRNFKTRKQGASGIQGCRRGFYIVNNPEPEAFMGGTLASTASRAKATRFTKKRLNAWLAFWSAFKGVIAAHDIIEVSK